MSRHTVVWLRDAQQDLAQLWMDSDDRQSVNVATATIDAVLAIDPQSKGQHLAEGLRKLRVAPLEVSFIVHDEDLLVEVASVKGDRISAVPAKTQQPRPPFADS